MKEKILIVDAYNMIGNWPELVRLKKADRLERKRSAAFDSFRLS